MAEEIPPLPMGWGIIGCGAVTEVKSGPAYQQVNRFTLKAVMRRDGEKAADYAKRHRVPKWSTDAQVLINDPEISAVYIATPPDSHCDYALEVARSRKICCVEKPMALNTAQCWKMVHAFEDAGIPLFVAFYRRSLPRFQQVHRWLEQGRIGTIRHVQWQFSRPVHERDLGDQSNWRTNPEIAGGGYFVDLASHGIDLLMFLLGDIAEVRGFCQRQAALYPAEDAVTAIWRHARQRDGTMATGCGFWNFCADGRRDLVEIIGSSGTIRFSIFEEQDIEIRESHHTDFQRLFIENPKHIQIHHVENIASSLFERKLHPSSGRTALKTTAVMESILTGKDLADLLHEPDRTFRQNEDRRHLTDLRI